MLDQQDQSVTERILRQLSATLSKLPANDPELLAELSNLQDRCLAIKVLGLEQTIYIRIELDAVVLTQEPPANIDVQIEGAPMALLGLLFAKDAMQSAQSSGIKIQGDLRTARQFSETMANLEIDWEDILAQYVGDFPALQLGRAMKGFWGWRKRVHESWQAAATEYMQEEARSLPTRVEVERFLDDVDKLRDAVERLAARMARL